MDGLQLEARKAFVSNTIGSDPVEIFLMALVTLSIYFTHTLVHFLMQCLQIGSVVKKFPFLTDNLLIVLPMLLSSTILSNRLLVINIFMITLFVIVLFGLSLRHYQQYLLKLLHCKSDNVSGSYLMNYKANIQITTAICILAVDFDIFPRRFAKAEVYGIGMMDMGVGTIIFSNALTTQLAQGQMYVSINSILSNMKRSLFLIALGAIRMILIKGINYQEHSTEYGLHWNFFFTIAVIKPLGNLILLLLNCGRRQTVFLFLSLIIIATYQVSLSTYGLTDIIQNGFYGDKSRTNIIDANREGIFSCFGYLSIYYAGLFFGRQLFKKNHYHYSKLLWLASWFVASYSCMTYSVVYISPISRQMANVSYYFIQIAFNSLLLFGFILIETICFALQSQLCKNVDHSLDNIDIPIPYLSRAVSKNLLMYFLLANVLTGLVNLLFDTLQCSPGKSLGILMSYMVLLNNMIWIVFICQRPVRDAREKKCS